MRKLVFFISVLASCSSSFAAETFFYPAFSRLDGIGGIGGALVGIKSLRSGRGTVVGGAAVGLNAQGLALLDFHVGECFSVNAGYMNLDQVRLSTNYGRGLTRGREFEQGLSGTALGASIDCHLMDQRWRLSAGFLRSKLNLDEFFVDGRTIQRPSVAGYHAVTTQSKFISLRHKGERLTATAGLATAEGRFGQSDQLVTSYSLTAHWPSISRLTFVTDVIWSDAYLMSHKKSFEDENSVRQALNTNCASLIDTQEAQDCHDLENSLADYIAANNSRGTARPAGGHRGVRAYNELSLRSRHSRVVRTEARVQVVEHFAIVPTFDVGWSSDHERNLYDRATIAYGASLAYKVSTSAIRLGYAQNADEFAWYLAFDSNL